MSYDSRLRAFVLSVGGRLSAVLSIHEKWCDELIPHFYCCEFVRSLGELHQVDDQSIGDLLRLVEFLMDSNDADLRDLLYATIFPHILEHAALKAEFLSAASPNVAKFFMEWLADFKTLFNYE